MATVSVCIEDLALSQKFKKCLLPSNIDMDELARNPILRSVFQRLFLKRTIKINNKDYICDIYKAVEPATKTKLMNYYLIIFEDGIAHVKIMDEIFFGEVTFYDLIVGDFVLEKSITKIKNVLSTIDNKTSKIKNELEIDYSFISNEKLIFELV